MYKNTDLTHTIDDLVEKMRGCISMYPNESHIPKSTKYKATLPESQPVAEKNKTKDPPGVSMPPEKEMSPAQLG